MIRLKSTLVTCGKGLLRTTIEATIMSSDLATAGLPPRSTKLRSHSENACQRRCRTQSFQVRARPAYCVRAHDAPLWNAMARVARQASRRSVLHLPWGDIS